MELSLQPDFETVKRRYEAFWHQAVVDRPLVSLRVPRTDGKALPEKEHPSWEAWWKDIGFRSERLAAELANTEYLGDALPVAWPDMGPEIFSAWCGCSYHYGQDTTWTDPCIFDWENDCDRAVFDSSHPLFQLLVRFTDDLIERGKGKFIVGLTDFHPGGDHLAALRDPQQLAVDMIENRDWIERKLESSYREYFDVYDFFYVRLREAGMPITSWTPLIHDGRYYIPSNDFSAMISKEMFDEAFLPGIERECCFLERSIYHLDGPGALQHLDSILAIEELDAVQWVPGAGHEGFGKWIEVYRRIQAAEKSLQILSLKLEELPLVFESLRPEGVWISGVSGVDDRETAERVIRRVERWE